ncbi:helix-turn-helix domain-containing protein [Mycolicibacterium llatzerense]|uniref:helix-turn-helix domain-containing protein n=1 Tax=Mycolicibacterium llatzerense TaxID=280871 RepID=UPI0021B65DDF|nr:helix-turn-helix domain-containing protein [Mycolicibacterium llatzerense]
MTASIAMRGLYDRDAAAEYLSTSPRHIDDLRRGGKLIAVFEGGKNKFPREELDRYIDGLKESA